MTRNCLPFFLRGQICTRVVSVLTNFWTYQSTSFGKLPQDPTGYLVFNDIANVDHIIRRVLLKSMLGLPSDEDDLAVIQNLKVVLSNVFD